MGLVSSKEKFEHDIKDTLEELHEPVISATLPEMPKYSLRLVDKEDIDVDDDYVFAKLEEKIEKKYKYYNIKEDDRLLAKVATAEERDKLIEELKTEKNVKEVKVEEEETKELYIISYEEAKHLAFTTAESIESGKKAKTTSTTKKTNNVVSNIRKGGTVSTSSSSNASAMLGNLSFRRPLNSSRVSARIFRISRTPWN